MSPAIKFLLLMSITMAFASCLTDRTGDSTENPSKAGTVFVEGGLMYPGEVLPPDFRVVAQNKATGERLVYDFAYMSKDKKYPNGIGYRIPLKPGTWRIWAESRGKKVSFLYKEGSVEVKTRSLKNIHLDQMTSGVP
jgi:hypothetical protein